MSLLRSPLAVARATACDVKDVELILSPLIHALDEQHILDPYVLVGALATAATESSFKLVEEAYYLKPESRRMAFFDRTKYGKVNPVTNKRYYGRSILQLTWDHNYLQYSRDLGVDLYHHPELALEPVTSCRILALYFRIHVARYCKAQQWLTARIAVNGINRKTGLPNRWERFDECVHHLLLLKGQG
jgi:hypothetical protein